MFAPTLQMHRIKCMTIKRGNGIIIVSGHAHKCHVIRNAICRRRTTSTKLLIGSSFWPYEFWSNNAFVISACRNIRFCSCNPCGLRMRITAHKYTVMTYRITRALSNYTNSTCKIHAYGVNWYYFEKVLFVKVIIHLHNDTISFTLTTVILLLFTYYKFEFIFL